LTSSPLFLYAESKFKSTPSLRGTNPALRNNGAKVPYHKLSAGGKSLRNDGFWDRQKSMTSSAKPINSDKSSDGNSFH
jgi:hypothetical protein